MTKTVDLNPKEVKVLLSGLHNLIFDTDLFDYITSWDSSANETISNLIAKCEESLRNGLWKLKQIWMLLTLWVRSFLSKTVGQ